MRLLLRVTVGSGGRIVEPPGRKVHVRTPSATVRRERRSRVKPLTSNVK